MMRGANFFLLVLVGVGVDVLFFFVCALFFFGVFRCAFAILLLVGVFDAKAVLFSRLL